MNYFSTLIISLLVLTNASLAQVAGDSSAPPPIPQDTVIPKKPAHVHRQVVDTQVVAHDTVAPRPDTARVVKTVVTRPLTHAQPFYLLPRARLHYLGVLRSNPWYNFFGSPIERLSDEYVPDDKDTMFYLLSGLLLCLSLIKVVFSKYMNNLLSLVFRASLKQKQIREQLQQTPLPSLLLNIFFVLIAGLYVVFLRQHYRMLEDTEFWLPLLYSCAVVGSIYLIKFTILKFTGWVFNMREAANTYIFIVFLVNKLLGIFLFPLLILMEFCKPDWATPLVTLSYVLIFCFFIYRYTVSFAPVRREVKVSPFHFFMYLCAFEIVPLLLIYKVLLPYF